VSEPVKSRLLPPRFGHPVEGPALEWCFAQNIQPSFDQFITSGPGFLSLVPKRR